VSLNPEEVLLCYTAPRASQGRVRTHVFPGPKSIQPSPRSFWPTVTLVTVSEVVNLSACPTGDGDRDRAANN
jgi:hypothetical protein